MSSCNLNECLDSTLLLAKHLLKSVTINKNFGAIPAIVCAPSQINQVFLNLITNAVQAMEAGHGMLMLTTRGDDGGVAVEIVDNGKGIAPSVLPKIFDPFFTTKDVGRGTGLGLAITYGIIQEHGGEITAGNAPDGGAVFRIELPATN